LALRFAFGVLLTKQHTQLVSSAGVPGTSLNEVEQRYTTPDTRLGPAVVQITTSLVGLKPNQVI